MSTTTTPATRVVMELDRRHLRRLRWAVRTVLALGVAASIAANVLHARPNPISQVISAWPPLALMLTVELISRVPTHQRMLAVLRLLAAAPIAAIAAWVSYWHMAGVAARYGETEAAAAYLLPLSVDGLVVVASVSLVEITGRLRAATSPPDAVGPAAAAQRRRNDVGQDLPIAARVPPAPASAPGPCASAAVTLAAHDDPQPAAPAASAFPPHISDSQSATPKPGERPTGHVQVDDDEQRPPKFTDKAPHPVTERATDSVDPTPAQTPSVHSTHEQPSSDRTHSQQETAPSDTASAVAYWHHRDPDLHPAQIATRIGRSERTVRRHWPPSPPRGAPRPTTRSTSAS